MIAVLQKWWRWYNLISKGIYSGISTQKTKIENDKKIIKKKKDEKENKNIAFYWCFRIQAISDEFEFKQAISILFLLYNRTKVKNQCDYIVLKLVTISKLTF